MKERMNVGRSVGRKEGGKKERKLGKMDERKENR
jgi:hypothetical protein